MCTSSDTETFITDLKNIILEQELRPIATEIVNKYSNKSFSEKDIMALFEKNLKNDAIPEPEYIHTQVDKTYAIPEPEYIHTQVDKIYAIPVDESETTHSKAVVDSPVAVVDSPVAVVDSPVAVVDSPVAVVDSPVAVVDSPVAVVESPVTVVDSPPDKVKKKVRKKRTKKNRISGINIFKKQNYDQIKNVYNIRKVDNPSLKSATIASELWIKVDQSKYKDEADKQNAANDAKYSETLKNQLNIDPSYN
jgi:hypothetical protein